MITREEQALAADLELAAQFGLKGFVEPPSDRRTAARQHDPDDAAADLALAKQFGLKGFGSESSPVDARPDLTAATPTNADLELARTFGLQGFKPEQDVAGAPATTDGPSSSAASAAVSTTTIAPARRASAASAPQKMQPTVRAIKGERFLHIRATRDAFSALETQIGCSVATAVRGQNSFHCRHNPNGSETRLFSIPSGGIVGLDLLHGEIVPGVHASIAPADLSHFRAAGASGAKPVQVQPQLIAALTKAVDR